VIATNEVARLWLGGLYMRAELVLDVVRGGRKWYDVFLLVACRGAGISDLRIDGRPARVTGPVTANPADFVFQDLNQQHRSNKPGGTTRYGIFLDSHLRFDPACMNAESKKSETEKDLPTLAVSTSRPCRSIVDFAEGTGRRGRDWGIAAGWRAFSGLSPSQGSCLPVKAGIGSVPWIGSGASEIARLSVCTFASDQLSCFSAIGFALSRT